MSEASDMVTRVRVSCSAIISVISSARVRARARVGVGAGVSVSCDSYFTYQFK